MQETCVGSLDWEDSLEKKMATHSSILAWRIPWTEEPGGLQSMGSQTDTAERLSLSLWNHTIPLTLYSISPTHQPRFSTEGGIQEH